MGKKEERAGLGEKMASLNSDSFILGSCWKANQDIKGGLDISGVEETVWGRRHKFERLQRRNGIKTLKNEVDLSGK